MHLHHCQGFLSLKKTQMHRIKKSLCTRVQKKNSVYSDKPDTIDDLNMAITEYILDVDRAIY
jgi:hypothetical protein